MTRGNMSRSTSSMRWSGVLRPAFWMRCDDGTGSVQLAPGFLAICVPACSSPFHGSAQRPLGLRQSVSDAPFVLRANGRARELLCRRRCRLASSAPKRSSLAQVVRVRFEGERGAVGAANRGNEELGPRAFPRRKALALPALNSHTRPSDDIAALLAGNSRPLVAEQIFPIRYVNYCVMLGEDSGRYNDMTRINS